MGSEVRVRVRCCIFGRMAKLKKEKVEGITDDGEMWGDRMTEWRGGLE